MRARTLLGVGAFLLLVGVGLGASPAAANTDVQNVTVYSTTDPGFEDGDALAEAIGTNRIESGDRVYLGDTLIVAIESDRLAGDVADASGATTTERLFDALDGEADLRIDRESNSHRNYLVARLGPDNVTALRSGSTTYVLVDVAAVDFYYDTRSTFETDPELDVEYDVYVSYAVDLENRSRATPVPDGPSFELSRTEGRFLPGQRFENIPPEEFSREVRVYEEPDELEVRAFLSDGRLRTDTLEGRSFPTTLTTTLDFSGLDHGTEYSIEVLHDGSPTDRFKGTIQRPTATLTDLNATQSGGETRLNLTAALTHGGGIVVENSDGHRIARAPVEGENVSQDLTIRMSDDVRGNITVRAVRSLQGDQRAYEGEHAQATVEVFVQDVDDEGSSESGGSDDDGGGSDETEPSEEEQASYLLVAILGVVVAVVAFVLLFVKLVL